MISYYLPGRTENAVKNQFYSLLRRQFRKYKGCEPSRKSLKKYESSLSSQILSALNKKLKNRHGIKKPKFAKVVVIEDGSFTNCAGEDQSERSTLLDEFESNM